MKRVLIIDDEKNIADILEYNLKKEGYEATVTKDGETGLFFALSGKYDIVLLDIMLPEMDGFDVCRKIREKSNIPIIMITAKEEELDKVLGIKMGADDYITKPFSVRELLVRIEAIFRRISASSEKPDGRNTLEFGELTIDLDKYEVKIGGKPVDLTLREFELLRFLATQQGHVFTREVLLEKVWGFEYYGDMRNVDVTVRRLRVKIEKDPSNPAYILMKRSVGYYFNTFE